jgi:TolB-like protein/DNA-binding winged helix-turn-helix (wHTH) protein/Tfp pilus assembly protein PilF
VDGTFRIGSWLIEPSLNTVSRNGASVHLAPKVMGVLLCLAQHAGEPVSKEDLLQAVWPDTFVGDDVLKVSVSELRRVLEDDAREPTIIQTISKRGYRLVAPVKWAKEVQESEAEAKEARGAVVNTRKVWLGALAVISAAVLLVLLGANAGKLRARIAGRVDAPQIHSLAVLPLRSLSSDPNQEYFSDGTTDALITDLAQISSLKVISHTSTLQYKDTKKSLPEIARELNADGIIEGTVQRSGDRVRITAQLIYGPSDKHLWANTYDGDLRDVFALERDVTEDIARQVQARVTTQNQAPPRSPRPVDPKVLEAYLQGKYHLNQQGKGAGDEEMREAQKYFQQAIDVDPNFAPAYLGLADSHGELLLGTSEDVAIGRRAIEKAVELDPNSSDARTDLGYMKWLPDLDWRGAEQELRRAVALNPNNANSHYVLCGVLSAMGRAQEGLPDCRIAQQIDPLNDNSSLPLYLARDYDGSIAILRFMLQKDPNNGKFHCFLFNDYAKKEMYKEAIQEQVQCYAQFGFPEVAANLQHAYAVSGYRGAIKQWAKDLEHLQATKKAFLPGNLAAAYAILGDKDHAFYWLDQAYEHRELVSIDGGIFFLAAEPLYDPLRSDPRFKDLLRRVGLPQ